LTRLTPPGSVARWRGHGGRGSGARIATGDGTSILGALAEKSPFPDEPAQKAAWRFTIDHLATVGAVLPDSHIFLEFAIPRMGRRADAIVVSGGHIFVLEYKVGATEFARHALAQVHGYALDLRHFHETSHARPIVPMLVATSAPPQDVGFGFAEDGVAHPMRLAAGDVLLAIRRVMSTNPRPPLDPHTWAEGAYRPTPTIIEAAQALYRGHRVEEISRSEAGAKNLTFTAEAIDRAIGEARTGGSKALVFVTGVPGAGKTLAGLNIACSRMETGQGEDATFLSGNGPLVEVLREALKRDHRRLLRARDPGDPDARHVAGRSPDKFVQNVHHFRDEYLDPHTRPSEHVVVFDEAQRAWDKEQTSRFMREKRGQPGFAMSEPEFLLSVMDRHPDWCTVICLVGEGQEINRGEAGIGAWIAALQTGGLRQWRLHTPPQLLSGETGLQRDLAWLVEQRAARLDEALHLAVSVRSFRAETVSAFVAALLGADRAKARSQLPRFDNFPICRTRELDAARSWLRARRRGTERAGILASSNAVRLRPEGLHVKAAIKVSSWFLDQAPDIRSSDMLEEVATEFDVQGLELDWTCVAWDLNLRRSVAAWQPRRFRGTAWQAVNDAAARAYVVNAYRVLLTRARQGMVIFVPRGDPEDPTRPPAEYDAIDRWLADCGIAELG
jgi:hypothetical protein